MCMKQLRSFGEGVLIWPQLCKSSTMRLTLAFKTEGGICLVEQGVVKSAPFVLGWIGVGTPAMDILRKPCLMQSAHKVCLQNR